MNKLTPSLTPGKFNNFKFEVINIFLNNSIIKKKNYLNIYWNSIMNELNENQYVLFNFKIKYSRSASLSLSLGGHTTFVEGGLVHPIP
jgi:hypothetical protein